MTEPVTLAPEAVDAVARRVVELLHDEGHGAPPPRLVDATALAQRLGVSRACVYEHRVELGAIRIGDGPRGRLRFDVEQAVTAWRNRERHDPEPERVTPRRRTTTSRAPLLPINEKKAA